MKRARGEVIGRAVLPTERGGGPRWMRRWWRRVRGYLMPRRREAGLSATAAGPTSDEAQVERLRGSARAVEPTGDCVAEVDMGQLDVAWRIANVRT